MINYLGRLLTDLKKEEQKSSDKKSAAISKSSEKPRDMKGVKGVRQDIDEADEQESYYKYMEENPLAGE